MARRNESEGIALGILGVLGMNFLVFFLLLNYTNYNSTVSLAVLFGICLYQLLYVVPAIIFLKRQQRWGLMKGVIIGAVTTALLSGPCFVMFILPR
ncbi:hypothetical protein Cri9333_4524 [Crinalium epipsammum PCC 9333]|uniref:Uncharacterized protein n=1 Tax=Crinalium epipsammum PCC 9333 TaxID=1173022 RepID=K9W756_9CYAN|nr:hypothetical protein [Crinalium epipsammum]AFZ15305.1 hypothetical protein Cri9333_4524 [Crinalium epipsammum PCC 9333]